MMNKPTLNRTIQKFKNSKNVGIIVYPSDNGGVFNFSIEDKCW